MKYITLVSDRAKTEDMPPEHGTVSSFTYDVWRDPEYPESPTNTMVLLQEEFFLQIVEVIKKGRTYEE